MKTTLFVLLTGFLSISYMSMGMAQVPTEEYRPHDIPQNIIAPNNGNSNPTSGSKTYNEDIQINPS